MSHRITDIWFRSELPLTEISARLGLGNVTEDEEDYWEWVIGTMMGERLDITRTHKRPAKDTYTRILLADGGSFPSGLLAEVVTRLQGFVPGSVVAGRWVYRSGQDFDLVVVREYEPAG